MKIESNLLQKVHRVVKFRKHSGVAGEAIYLAIIWVNFRLYILANIKNVCLWLIDLSYIQYMSTGCVGCRVKGDVSVRSVIPVYNINSSSLTGEKHPHYMIFHCVHVRICMLNCMYNIDMVVKDTLHPLSTWKHTTDHF